MYTELIKKNEEELKEEFASINKLVEKNSEKVIKSFWKHKVDDTLFNTSTGYGYGDKGRDVIEQIFADVLGTEDALVRIQFISGTHALSTAFFGILRTGDTLLSICGKPYDTLDEVIGIRENASSLKTFGIKYSQIELTENGKFDEQEILSQIKNDTSIKLVTIQRSRGYSFRNAISVEEINNIYTKIKQINPNIVVMVDNCYGEFVDFEEPKVDILVGSLIKNIGGGIAPTGAYIAGKKEFVELCADRLAAPGLGKEGGPSLGYNKQILQGIFFAPKIVGDSLKIGIVASKIFEGLGYEVSPRYNEKRNDIITAIKFNDENKLIKFCQGIQSGSPVDSNVTLAPWDMPGYDSKIIMASGAFTQGSSIEISADGPIKPPYIAYMQGGLIYEYSKIALNKALENIQGGN